MTISRPSAYVNGPYKLEAVGQQPKAGSDTIINRTFIYWGEKKNI